MASYALTLYSIVGIPFLEKLKDKGFEVIVDKFLSSLNFLKPKAETTSEATVTLLINELQKNPILKKDLLSFLQTVEEKTPDIFDGIRQQSINNGLIVNNQGASIGKQVNIHSVHSLHL